MKNDDLFIIMNNYCESAQTKDLALHLSLYSDDVYLYDCWDTWEIKGKEALSESVEDWFDGLVEEEVNLKVQFIDPIFESTDSLAFIHSEVLFTAYDKDNYELRHISNRFTFNLKKMNNEWKIIHQHSSLPINPSTAKMMIKE